MSNSLRPGKFRDIKNTECLSFFTGTGKSKACTIPEALRIRPFHSEPNSPRRDGHPYASSRFFRRKERTTFSELDAVSARTYHVSMLPRKLFKILTVLAVAALFSLPVPVFSGDMTWCEDNGLEGEQQLKCLLWNLVSFTRPLDETGLAARTSGPVALGPALWAEFFCYNNSLDSPWPEQIRIKFSQHTDGGVSVLEEISDQNLDGLKPDQGGDVYLRFQDSPQPVNLLRGLDANLYQPVNADYLSRLKEILAALESRLVVHSPLVWKDLKSGLQIAVVKAFRFIRIGQNEITILRLDPALFQIVPFSDREKNTATPMNIEGWAQQLPEATAVLNAGQYYPDRLHMGLFQKKGNNWGTTIHPNWKALLLSGGPADDPIYPPSFILDMEKNPDDTAPGRYDYIVQSFMLLDEDGRPRVRQTDRLASRTVIAQDHAGRLLVVAVSGACTLYELALWLKEAELDIRRAMCLDGGFESQLFVRTGSEDLVHYGSWVVNERRQFHSENLKLPLPAVLAVMPRPSAD